jgi:peroxiredoxin
MEMALALVSHPETRETGTRAIRDLLAHLAEETDEERPLDATPAEVHEESLQLQASLRVALARQLLATGDDSTAVRELEAADALGVWLPGLYRTRLEASLGSGNDAAARADYHRLEVDPVYSRDSVAALLQRIPPVSGAELREGRARAEAEMVRRLLAMQGSGRGLPAARLRTPTGLYRSVESLVAGRPAIVLFWDRRVFDSTEDVADAIQAARLLEGGPGQLLWITPEPDSESLRAFTRRTGLPMPAYHDPGAEFASALGMWGKRGFYVIDGAGMIRVRTHSLMEAVRHLEVLQVGSRNTA